MPNAAAIGAKIGPKIKFVAPTSKNIPQMSSKMIINNKNVYLLLATVINAFVTATGIYNTLLKYPNILVAVNN